MQDAPHPSVGREVLARTLVEFVYVNVPSPNTVAKTSSRRHADHGVSIMLFGKLIYEVDQAIFQPPKCQAVNDMADKGRGRHRNGMKSIYKKCNIRSQRRSSLAVPGGGGAAYSLATDQKV